MVRNLGTIQTQLIMQHALKDNRPDDQRRRQLRAILKKYRDLSANKEELAAAMKKKFGISLVFFGQKDSPYGYAIVDHKNKTVFKGGEFISIRELLQFEDAATRFSKIEQTIDDILKDNPSAPLHVISIVCSIDSSAHVSIVVLFHGTMRPSILASLYKISSDGIIVSPWAYRQSLSESSIFHKKNKKRLHPRILLIESWMHKAVPVMLIENTKSAMV
jgi:hypothetical protein